MEKEYIGIIDMSFEGISTLNTIKETLNNEHLLYINDPKHAPYDDRGLEEILELVSKSYEQLANYKLKALIVISDTICEHAINYIESLGIPFVNLIDVIVKSINKNYSQKIILLLSKKSVLEANLIQKDITYSRLYTIESDKMIDVVENKKPKTAESFSVVQSLFKSVSSKEIDIVVPSSPSLFLLSTDYREYLKEVEVLDLNNLVAQEIKKKIKVE